MNTVSMKLLQVKLAGSRVPQLLFATKVDANIVIISLKKIYAFNYLFVWFLYYM